MDNMTVDELRKLLYKYDGELEVRLLVPTHKGRSGVLFPVEHVMPVIGQDSGKTKIVLVPQTTTIFRENKI